MNMQASLLIYELRARFGVNVAVFFLRSQVNKGAVWIAELSLDPYLLLITLINYNFGPKENFFVLFCSFHSHASFQSMHFLVSDCGLVGIFYHPYTRLLLTTSCDNWNLSKRHND